MSTQLSPHVVNGAVQLATHAPDWHIGVAAGQTLPHAPQLFGSAPSSTHAPLHVVASSAQPHCPFTHASFAGHAAPHAPQLLASLERSTHAALHDVSPTAHDVWHCPFEHTSPAPHACPHDPQFAESVSRFVH